MRDCLEVLFSGGFWGVESRPDIAKELGAEKYTSIVEWGRRAITQLVHLVAGEVYTDGEGSEVLTEAKKRLEQLAPLQL